LYQKNYKNFQVSAIYSGSKVLELYVYAETELIREETAIERFPQLKPLVEFKGQEVPFSWQNKQFVTAAISADFEGYRRLTFGLWEKEGDTTIPAAYCDATFNEVTKKVAIAGKFHDLSFTELPPQFARLDDIEMTKKDDEDGVLRYYATAMDVKYRKTGLAYVFYAQAMVVFETLGAQEINIVGDKTVRTSGIDNATGATLRESFYSQYTPNPQTKYTENVYQDGELVDFTSTNDIGLSAIQEGILMKAFQQQV
jgi:hypothetical protein